jgi:hypothetical protein
MRSIVIVIILVPLLLCGCMTPQVAQRDPRIEAIIMELELRRMTRVEMNLDVRLDQAPPRGPEKTCDLEF